MSDALSDIAHDEERLERVGNYLAALYKYLAAPTPDGFTNVVSLARHLDSLRGRGYWTGETTESVGVEERLERLAAGDHKAWKEFLGRLSGSAEHAEFKKLSPFREGGTNG